MLEGLLPWVKYTPVDYGIRFSDPVTALRARIRAKSNSEAA
jgi:hypothetical protein